jgi:small multidrug resistance pump/quaternary ammonium compound-resistance protein SugE
MSVALLFLASVAYAVGGLLMKLSNGATHAASTVGFLALFAGGALLQSIGMKHEAMGVTYVFVLGAEALVAVLLSALYLNESYTASRLAAIALVLIGIVWLRTA